MDEHARARRWAGADRNACATRMARLEFALRGAINLLSVREQTAASRELLAGWQELLKETPPDKPTT